MKKNTLKLTSLVIMATLLIMGLSCCKKTTPAPSPTPVSYGTLLLHLHTQFDTSEVDYGNIASSVETGGRNIKLGIAQMIISGVKLKESSGSYYTIPDFAFVKSVDTEPYVISTQVPYGSYIAPAYSIGLPADSNNLNPSSFPSGSYLGTNYLDMWTGNTSTGYIWLKFEGWIDTSASGTGQPTCPFSIQITSANTTPVAIALPARGIDSFRSYQPLSASNSVITMHMILNYAYLFNGVSLAHATPAQLNTATNANLAATVVKNMKVVGDIHSHSSGNFIHYEE